MTEILKMKNLKIEGYSDEKWTPIVKGVDVTLNKGERIVHTENWSLNRIGES